MAERLCDCLVQVGVRFSFANQDFEDFRQERSDLYRQYLCSLSIDSDELLLLLDIHVVVEPCQLVDEVEHPLISVHLLPQELFDLPLSVFYCGPVAELLQDR